MQDLAASPRDAAGVSPLVAGAGADGLRIRLAPARAGAKEPFVVLHAGRDARVLLGEVVGGAAPLLRFAWKLRADLPAPHRGSSGEAPCNRDVDARWQRERDHLARVDSRHVLAAVPVPAAMLQSPPLFHCRHVDRSFHPVCPDTGAVLRVCRDDAVLAAAGLPPYGTDTARYLHHGRRDGPPVFYTAAAAPTPASPARIGSTDELLRGWARLATAGADAAAGGAGGSRSAVAPDPAAGFPCRTCEHRRPCWADRGGGARPLAAERLAAVSFYDVDAVALELADADFLPAVAALGGADTGAWLCADAPEQRMLEVLRLKLAAFADVCRGVAAVHALGRPYLAIAPGSVVAIRAAAGAGVPARWQYRFALTGLGEVRSVSVPGYGDVLQPSARMLADPEGRLFLPPALRSTEGHTVTMAVACREAAAGAGPSRLVVDVHRAGVPPFVLPGDLLLVKALGESSSRVARVDECNARGLSATLVGDAAAACRAWAGRTFEAQLSFVKMLSPTADLHGLGMLLLHVLLVDDELAFPQVAAAAERCAQRLVDEADAERSEDSSERRWRELLEGPDGEGRFACRHLLHVADDRARAEAASAAIPPSIWWSVLGLAGKLLIAPGQGADPVQPVLAELQALLRRVDVELFDRVRRDASLAAICRSRAAECEAELAADPAPLTTMAPQFPGIAAATAPGFTLTVERIGTQGALEHSFVVPQVTIGRRESDNVLHLNDPMVSSKHAVIERDGDDWVVFDRGSTNGTEVDGIRLPIEVPQPLEDGAVIHIRPFRIVFRRGAALQGRAAPPPPPSAEAVEQLLARLTAAYADAFGEPAGPAAAVSAVLDRARAQLGRSALHAQLEALVRRLLGPQHESDQAGVRERQLAAEALRALQQLARSLVGPVELGSAELVADFAARLEQFVVTTTRWFDETLDVRRAVVARRLPGIDTGDGRPPLAADELLRELLAPRTRTGDGDFGEARRLLLACLEELPRAVVGLLQTQQQLRQAVRERLDPDRLVESVRRDGGLRLLVHAAAGSALWRRYGEVFREVTADDGRDTHLLELLQRAVQRRDAGR